MATPAPSPPSRHSSSPPSSPGTKRLRSVQFSPTESSIMPSQHSSVDSTHESHEHESSADETTAIVARQHGPRKDYGTRSDAEPAGQEVGERTGSRSRAGGSSVVAEARGEGESQLEDQTKGESWWKRAAEKYGSIELDNKGSVARDHLALERTFLAWLRTSLAFASIGVAITQLFRLNTTISPAPPGTPSKGFLRLRQVGKPLGATFLGIAVVVLFIGFHRYFESQHWIIKGKFPASRGSVALVAFIAALLIVVSLAVVLVVEPSSFEK